MGKSNILDDFDRRLLELVRHDNQTPARILAEELGLSISAVLRRLRRLREEKVIIADIAVLDPKLLGAAITIHVLVRLRQSGHQDRDDFAKAVGRRTEVTGAWEVAGEEHFILKVQVASMKDYDAFTREALDEEAGVEEFKTLVAVRSIVSDSMADHIRDHPIW